MLSRRRSGRWAIVAFASTGVFAAAGIVPTAAGARSFTIETGTHVVKQLGPLNTRSTRSYAPTIGRAIRAYGRPSSRFHKQGSCIVKWRRLGLRIAFANFGAGSATVCDDGSGLAQSFSITKSTRWRTSKGLRIGMREERIWDLHPNAEYYDDHEYYEDGYWLREARSPFGDGGLYPVLSAGVTGMGGRVNRFDGWIGAAGE